MDRSEQAGQYFMEGYNCAQSIAVAFCDLFGMEKDAAARMASSFGGGMGRMREVCGAVSGMLLVAGILYGYHDPADLQGKKEHYTLVQELAGKFREQVGSIVCREILKNPPSDPAPTPRTAEFYAKRPCVRMIMLAARILEDYIEAHPLA